MTAKEQREHFKTEQHAESVKVQEYLGSQAEEKKKPKAAGEVKPDNGAISTAELNEIINLKVDESGKWWLCDICTVKTNSEEMHLKHLDSKKHRARVQDIELNKKKVIKEFSCGICDYICYSAEDRDAHVQSDSHIRKVILSENPTSTTVQALADTDEPAVNPIRAADNTIWYPCETCDCKMNSLENYRVHINSKKHKAKVMGVSPASAQARKQKYTSAFLRENYNRFVQSKAGLSSKLTGNPSAFCAKCEIQFETPAKLETHFLTTEHKQFIPIKRKYCFNQETEEKKPKKAKTVTQPKPNHTLENYGYGNPNLHVLTVPQKQYTNTYAKPVPAQSGPASYSYLSQKPASSYGYNAAPSTPATSHTYPSYGESYQSSSYRSSTAYQGYSAKSYSTVPNYTTKSYSSATSYSSSYDPYATDAGYYNAYSDYSFGYAPPTQPYTYQ